MFFHYSELYNALPEWMEMSLKMYAYYHVYRFFVYRVAQVPFTFI